LASARGRVPAAGNQNERWLLDILLFNSVSAAAGGISVSGDFVGFPLAWLRHSPFHSYLIPGLVLFVVVGGSAVLAAVAVLREAARARELTMLSGIIMAGWVVSELAFVRLFSFLQVLYFATGIAVIMLAPAASNRSAASSARR